MDNTPIIDNRIIEEHGLSLDEYDKIIKILNREPNYVELGIFSVMWSEHCSYKSSIKMIKTLPREGGKLLVGAGEENAGLVDLGDGLATAFKIESHNHPSAVEPYEGAATGVGGIMRDVFTMGARPIASMNSLRFGNLKIDRNKFLLEHVVEGIADYGNCLGIPTVGGEVVIEDVYSGNPLVNAMSVGIVKIKNVASAIAEGKGNPVFIVGSSTGRDGIHGATFASVELTEETESKRSNVQVGDPFTEKLLLEATLELCKKPWLVGIQDMGAAGITCSCSEMSAKGKSGIKINLDLVPLRESDMNAYEIMLSESQERMLVVIKDGFEKELNDIFEKWELDCQKVGEVTDTGHLEVYHKDELIADIPSGELVLGGGAPQYDMDYKEPEYFTSSNQFTLNTIEEPSDYNKILISLLSSPTITSKEYVYSQYDSTVRTNTVIGPGGDAAVIRIKDSKKALCISTDCNGRYVYLNPRKGGMIAVAESARNVACSGGRPLAITNCLNFGNPQDPEIYWQFREAVLGIGDACRAFDTPVTGGNVSFYNESLLGAVYPTPVIGMVGILEDSSKYMDIAYKQPGDFIVAIGSVNGGLGGSEYLKICHDIIEGPIPEINLEIEKHIQTILRKLISNDIINSAHDISDGGLAVNIAESICLSKKGIGAEISINRKLRNDEMLFGESQGVVIVSVPPEKLDKVALLSQEYKIHSQTIGMVTDNSKLMINDLVDLKRARLQKSYLDTLEKVIHS